MLTTRFVDGSPNWIDLGTPDLDGAASFYGALFGWRFWSAGPGAGGHGFFQLGGATVAGGTQITPKQGPPSWTVYFRTPDAEATARISEQAHGGVLMRPVDVMGKGRTAILTDRAGVPFGVRQPGRPAGLDLAGEPGSLCWVELYTPDVPAAAAYYRAVLGLETSAAPFPGGTYTCVTPAGQGEDGVFGGFVPPAGGPAGTEPHWLPYIEVSDADAAAAGAEELGGAVHTPATDIEGVGRVARLADPYGARFAVIETAPREA
ncbi:VOC family protein [Streptomyces sp. enrichment culture]|uniref:VOC family protein n=1 Tax=Streptomyces sp. enrichment culture TaxID=1795815 RepID=UPI003F544642